jgi:arsenate reductase
MITLYGIPNCGTIKKTRNFLTSQELDFHFHNYKKDGCTTALIRQFLAHFSWQELLNTRGTTWRKLSDSEKNSLNTESAIELMQRQPSIIKRPLLQQDSIWILGFNEEKLSELIRGSQNE